MGHVTVKAARCAQEAEACIVAQVLGMVFKTLFCWQGRHAVQRWPACACYAQACAMALLHVHGEFLGGNIHERCARVYSKVHAILWE